MLASVVEIDNQDGTRKVQGGQIPDPSAGLTMIPRVVSTF